MFFSGDYQKRMNADIITTGNKLVKNQIEDFSNRLNLNELHEYASEVKGHTDAFLKDAFLASWIMHIKASLRISQKLL